MMRRSPVWSTSGGACFARLDELRPAATLTYTAELHAGLEGVDPEAPLLHVGDALSARAGYSLEPSRRTTIAVGENAPF